MLPNKLVNVNVQKFIPKSYTQQNYYVDEEWIDKSKITNQKQYKQTVQFIFDLQFKDRRRNAFKGLNERQELEPNMAPLLWYSTGTMALLLQEIISIYPHMTDNQLSPEQSGRVCDVLGLFQCVALNKKTKILFLKASMHLYVYPLINIPNPKKEYEHIRVTSLGVIGALVKGEHPHAIKYLIKTEIIVLCLKIMKKGNLVSKTVATFVVLKILIDSHGLDYVCKTSERLFAVVRILREVVDSIAKNGFDPKKQGKIMKQILRSFLRLSENKKI